MFIKPNINRLMVVVGSVSQPIDQEAEIQLSRLDMFTNKIKYYCFNLDIELIEWRYFPRIGLELFIINKPVTCLRRGLFE